MSAIPIGFQIANKNKEALLQDIGRAKFAENLRAELSNDTAFILIHLAGQYLCREGFLWLPCNN